MKINLGHAIIFFTKKGLGLIGQVSLVKHVRRKSRKNNMKLSNGPEPGFYDKSKPQTYGVSTINIIRTSSYNNLPLFSGTIDSTFMMTTEGFIMFNTDIRWDETLDRFVEFEKR